MIHRAVIVSFCLGLLLAAGAAQADDAEDVAKKLDGTWIVESVTRFGEAVFPPKGTEVVFARGVMTTKPKKGEEERYNKLFGENRKFKLDPSKQPNEINFDYADDPSVGFSPKGIFELGGDDLKLCIAAIRPTEFDDKKGQLWVLKRKK
jgi:uncharacterized protein (TIGR03067 family)